MASNQMGIPRYTPPHRRPGLPYTVSTSLLRDSITLAPTPLKETSNVLHISNHRAQTLNQKLGFDAPSLKTSPSLGSSKDIPSEKFGSEDSDVNLLQNRGRGLRYGSVGFENHKRMTEKPASPVLDPERHEYLAEESKNRHALSPEAEGVSLRNTRITNGQLAKKEPSDDRAEWTPDEQASQDTMDELKRLRGQIVAQAHMNRCKDLSYPTANPEILTKCRDGPGTDPQSFVYKNIAKFRLVRQPDGSDSNNDSKPLDVFPTSPTEQQGSKNYTGQKELYNKSPSIYPMIVERELTFSPQPTSEQRGIIAKARKSRSDPPQDSQSKMTPAPDGDQDFIPNWDYCPRVCLNFEVFRSSFHSWLEDTRVLPCYVDIYHQAFFDGTAHANGKRSFFIPDLDGYETHLDVNDAQSLLHAHENAEGYCHNLGLHIKIEEHEQQNRREKAREIYLEGFKISAQIKYESPKANIYLRPVEHDDIPQLVNIYNWYAKNAIISIGTGAVDAEDVRQLVEGRSEEKLPFIVAVGRGVGSAEKILGYALATDFVGARTAGRFTAELEVFVKEKHKRQGIGKCLMDKLLEVCDPTYIPKSGYIFEASPEVRSRYYGGGRRRLARLIVTVSYSDSDRSNYQWVKAWLEKGYQFEEQGLLRGARVKFGKFLNVSYLVRNVGHSNASTWE